MGYGLKVKNSAGTVVLDTSAGDTITRLRYSNEVSSASNTTLSDTSGHSTVEISYMLGTDRTKVPWILSRSGTTYSWSDQSISPLAVTDALIFVFMYS